MPKKIRVYELARELGISNKEALDLCGTLGIGVRSHSSSIEDAQADRVRRKATNLGLGPSAEQATSSTEGRPPRPPAPPRRPGNGDRRSTSPGPPGTGPRRRRASAATVSGDRARRRRGARRVAAGPATSGW
ncbi:MAG TPA: translation initiation factor IF-2 N-terminal domain-containing protein [Acidimicrobiales bacterium]|nr:translation initiation factor IF-2 N-terminal domain-containing protein [Acidimicrobiales bacterium]